MTDLRKSLARLSFETVGSIVAIVVGIAALFVAWDEARSVRKQQAASVLPVLKIASMNTNDETGAETSIVVQNVGIGPAFIESARIEWGDTVVDNVEDLRAFVADGQTSYGIWTSRLEGEILGGGEHYDLFAVTISADELTRENLSVLRTAIFDNLQISACFCSVYDDCWTTSLNKKYRPEPADECRRRAA